MSSEGAARNETHREEDTAESFSAEPPVSRLREIDGSDAAGLDLLAELHMELLGFGPMARLGTRFIRDICYATHMRDNTLRAAVYEVGPRAAGFVAYTDRSISFHRASLKRHWLATGWILMRSILADPRRLASLGRAVLVVLSRRSEIREGRDPMGEVVCVAARREYLRADFVRRTGRHISEELIRYAARQLHGMGVKEMRMLVDADNRAVQLLYHRLGARFEPYELGGTSTLLVWFDLAALISGTVEAPVS